MTNDIVDFEDFFYTKDSIESDVRDLYRSWNSLYQANKKNNYVKGEYKSFKAWADVILKNGAPMFGANTQVDTWKQRYSKAYSYAENKAGPDPLTYNKPFRLSDLANSPWEWIGGAFFLSILVGKLTK